MKFLKPKDKFGKKKMPKTVKIILLLFLIAFVAFGIYAALSNAGYIKAFKTVLQLQSQQQEDQKVLEKLGRILTLPEGVQPTMAMVTDVDKLKSAQPFFANAKNNDRLIIYPDMAIIYDAKANKIIKVGPVQLAETPAAAPVNFAIYNSLRDDPANTKTAEMENKIKTAFNNAVVTVKENSAKFDYPKTLVVDIAGNNPDMQKIADALGANLSGLPIGEKKPAGVA